MLRRSFTRAREWARRVRRDVRALWIAARDRWTPLVRESRRPAQSWPTPSHPSTSIPDFVPVLGYLDDLILLPLGILLAVRLVPKPLMQEYRAAATRLDDRPASKAGLALIVAIWLCVAGLTLWWLMPSLINSRSPR